MATTKKVQAAQHAEYLRGFAESWDLQEVEKDRLLAIADFLTPAPSKAAVDKRSKPWNYVLRLWHLQPDCAPELLGESEGVLLTTGHIPTVIAAEMSEFFDIGPAELPSELMPLKVQERLTQLRNNLARAETASTLRIEFDAGYLYRLDMEIIRPNGSTEATPGEQ